MIKNYFKIAWRSMARNKLYSAINILGLAIGMAVVLLISLWIWDELSYNKNFKNYDHIAQVMITGTFSNSISTDPSTPVPLATSLQSKYGTDFKHVVTTSYIDPHILAFEDKKLGKSGMYVQPVFPEMFTLEMIGGTCACLNDPSSIAIDQSLAKALFGNDNPIGKQIKLDNKSSMKVSGVFENFSRNSAFNGVAFFAPWAAYASAEAWVKKADQDWFSCMFQTFAQVKDGVSIEGVSEKVKKLMTEHQPAIKPEVILQPMSKWHLNAEFKDGKNVGGQIQFVWMFGIIGLFVLLLACINFMNLSTARSGKRAREVGIRKTVGSGHLQLIAQFLGESVLIAFIAFLLSLAFVQFSLPWFNGLAGKQMGIAWKNGWFWLAAIGFTLFTGILAGSYPAFYLSSFSPLKVLKGSFKAGRSASIFRKVLVVLQFTVSVSLIIGTIIVFQQIRYAKNRPLGYLTNGLIGIYKNTPDLFGHYDAMRGDLINSGGAVNMAESSSPVNKISLTTGGYEWEAKNPNVEADFGTVAVTHDFASSVGWQFKEGRNFSKNFGADSSNIIINEAVVKYIGFKKALGRPIHYKGKIYNVIGIIQNPVMGSAFSMAVPVVFFLDERRTNIITVKLNPALAAGEALKRVEAVFKKYNPGSSFEYTFVDEDYAKTFHTEERIGSLSIFFAVFAVFISCLGLFGMASFMAEQRTKEIGVRKVLGASVFNVWGLLSKDFVVLVIISLVISVPIAYYLMHNWLQHYDYRTAISWWVFVAAGFGAILITLLTVSFQAIKAAIANPVKSLKME